jgi:hypothetical protein
MAYAATEAEGRKLAHERFRFSAFDWSVNSEVPTVEGFEAATKYVRPEDLAETSSAGPDPEVHLKAIRKGMEAGFDHIVLTGVRRQNIWRISRRKLAECGPRPGVDIKRRSCGGASGDVRWSSV